MELLLRKDLQTFASTCEKFLSTHLEPVLSPEEERLIVYYAHELAHKFEPVLSQGSGDFKGQF